MKRAPRLPSRRHLDAFLRAALAEDAGPGDVTTRLTVPASAMAEAVCITRKPCVAAGLPAALRVFQLLDRRVRVLQKAREGARLRKSAVLFRVRGKARALLTGERTALNLLGRMCGVATLAAAYARELRGTKCLLLDTRKTTPLMRVFEKYAVRTGGGHNHRFGLYDAVLVKENHLALAGGVKEALRRVRRAGVPWEIEVRNLAELRQALAHGARWIMLDNFPLPLLRKAVSIARGRALLEASGGITLRNARAAARTGVDFLSVGALTHSAPAADLSMRMRPAGR
jgi:nicotinate-nucleotide pyrophosphorylase (carboxylating)